MIDLLIFTIATLEDGSIYLGLFSQWFLVQTASTTTTKNDEEAEKLHRLGVEYKSSLKYDLSGDYFTRAAQEYLALGDIHEGGRCHEEAYKSYKTAKLDEKSIGSLKQAADCFAQLDAGQDRAARHFETIGKYYYHLQNLDQALLCYEMSESCFRQVSDGRAEFIKKTKANVLACQKKYQQALVVFEELARNGRDNLATHHAVSTFLFSSLMCHLFLDDWTGAANKVTQFEHDFASFSNTNELLFIRLLLSYHESLDVDQLLVCLDKFTRTFFGEAWIAHGLQEIRDKLASHDISVL